VPAVIRTGDVEEAVRVLRDYTRRGDTVLVKASRSARLERVVQALEKGAAV
jgi:UDP-N-acetylmuramyl pentapeptide synthase